MNMRLLGAPTIADIGPDMVDATNIHQHIVPVPSDRLYDANCESYFPLAYCFRSLTQRVSDEGMQGAVLSEAKRDVKAGKLSKL